MTIMDFCKILFFMLFFTCYWTLSKRENGKKAVWLLIGVRLTGEKGSRRLRGVRWAIVVTGADRDNTGSIWACAVWETGGDQWPFFSWLPPSLFWEKCLVMVKLLAMTSLVFGHRHPPHCYLPGAACTVPFWAFPASEIFHDGRKFRKFSQVKGKIWT